jgi:hypothetical protein
MGVAFSVALSAATFISVWKSPDIRGMSLAGKKAAALVISDDINLRTSAEEALASELTARGAQGVAAYRLIPKEELGDKEKARGWFERANVAAVVVMRPVASKQEVIYSPVTWTTSYYGSLWDYYGYAWTTGLGPVRSYTDTTVTVETLIFGMPDGKLLWASASEKTNPKSTGKLVAQLVKDIAKEMRKEGLVPKGSQ